MLVPVEATSPQAAELIATTRRAVPPEASVAAYVNLLGPVAPDNFEQDARRLLQARPDELHLYHFGLANERQVPLFARLASLA